MVITYSLLLIWNKKSIVLDYVMKHSSEKSNLILQPIYTIGIAIFLLSILVGTIIILFKRRKYKMKNTNLKNYKNEYVKCYKEELDKSSFNVKKYYFKPVGLSTQDFIKELDNLEVVLDTKIHHISYGKNTDTIIVYGTPFKYLKPRGYSLSTSDEFLRKIINLLCVGATGSGKTYFLRILIANLVMYYENAKLYLCDFKNYDFSEFNDCKRYYGYKDVVKGIKEVYQIFNERISSIEKGKVYEPIILFIDEYATMLFNLGKEAEEIQKMISEILFMGRSYNIIPIIGLQRADSTYFKNGARDQFKTIVALGNLSKEQKNMLFQDYRDSMDDVNGLGEGYVYEDGQNFLQKIKVNQITNEEKNIITYFIRQALEK